MRISGLVVAAAVAFTMSSSPVWAQAKKGPDLGPMALKRHVCDCRKMNTVKGKLDEKRFAQCTARRLGYDLQASTVASTYCPAPAAKGKKG